MTTEMFKVIVSNRKTWSVNDYVMDNSQIDCEGLEFFIIKKSTYGGAIIHFETPTNSIDSLLLVSKLQRINHKLCMEFHKKINKKIMPPPLEFVPSFFYYFSEKEISPEDLKKLNSVCYCYINSQGTVK